VNFDKASYELHFKWDVTWNDKTQNKIHPGYWCPFDRFEVTCRQTDGRKLPPNYAFVLCTSCCKYTKHFSLLVLINLHCASSQTPFSFLHTASHVVVLPHNMYLYQRWWLTLQASSMFQWLV